MSDGELLRGISSFEIDCLRVEKVFDACSTRVCTNFVFHPNTVMTGESGTVRFADIAAIVSCVGNDGAKVVGTITSRPGTPIAVVNATITGFVTITVRTTAGALVELVRRVQFTTRVLLFAPRPQSMFVGGEAIIRCLGCVLNPETMTIQCSVGAFVIIKVLGKVEVQIPVLGICPIPPECTVLAEATACEVFLNAELTEFPAAAEFFPAQQNTIRAAIDDDC